MNVGGGRKNKEEGVLMFAYPAILSRARVGGGIAPGFLPGPDCRGVKRTSNV